MEGLNPLNTIAEAATYLRVSPKTVRRYIKAGHLPVRQLPTGGIRLRRDDVLALAVDPTPSRPASKTVKREPRRLEATTTRGSVTAALAALEAGRDAA